MSRSSAPSVSTACTPTPRALICTTPKGEAYLDFLSGYSVFNIGRNHPVVAQAIRDVLDLDLPNMVQMDCSLLSGLLGEALLKKMPAAPGRRLLLQLGHGSGRRRHEVCPRRHRAAADRQPAGSYHGLSYGALSITGNENFQEGFGPMLADTERVPLGDLDALEATLAMRDVAAFIVEPVQGKGVKFPKDDYFQRAQELCREHGTLLDLRRGADGAGADGEMVCLRALGPGAGYHHDCQEPQRRLRACGAVVARRWIYQSVFSRLDRCVVHSSTFGRNNLAMACGLATLTCLEDENLVENAAADGRAARRRGSTRCKAKHPFIKEVRGKGLMIAIEFHEPPKSRSSSSRGGCCTGSTSRCSRRW